MRLSFILGVITTLYALGYSIITVLLPFITAAVVSADSRAGTSTEGGDSTTGWSTGRAYGAVLSAYPIAKAVMAPVLGQAAGCCSRC